MISVYLYQGEGTFEGPRVFEWNCPEVGSRHKFILFLAQKSNTPEQEVALVKVSAYGFKDIELGEGAPIVVESMNEPQMRVFSRYYEGALEEGNFLVWYP